MGMLIGIDLGTTNSCMAILRDGIAQVIPNDLGANTTPSVVSMKEDGTVVVGAAAKRRAISHPKATIFAVKRLIGRRYDSAEVAALRKIMPYDIVEGPNGEAWVVLGDRAVSPAEVSAHILAYLRRAAEKNLGRPVTEAIITVPAYFDDAQRQATKTAGALAGLSVPTILNEPTAGALAYGVQRTGGAASIYAVFDLGGGTFDFSLLRAECGVFEVLATSGDTFLGGEDFDRLMIESLVRRFQASSGVDLTQDAGALGRLAEAVQAAKHELTTLNKTIISLPFVTTGASGGVHLECEVDRDWLEALVQPLIARLEAPIARALADAGVSARQIDQVVLVGGMTRMPRVQRRVVELFGKPPTKGVNPDEIVAIGAATQSAVMTGDLREVVLLDVTPHSIRIHTPDGQLATVIPRNTMIPTREAYTIQTHADDQVMLTFAIYQGDHPSLADDRCLGRFAVADLPPGPAGSVQVEISFLIDADGILSMEGLERRTGRVSRWVIQSPVVVPPGSDADPA